MSIEQTPFSFVFHSGKTIYPQDIEWIIQTAHTLVRPSCCAAFVTEEKDGHIVIVAEVRRDLLLHEQQAVETAIRQVFISLQCSNPSQPLFTVHNLGYCIEFWRIDCA
jgi:hypothetical protein